MVWFRVSKLWIRVPKRGYSSESHLTKNRYPYIKRGNYAELSDSHVRTFENILGKSGVLTNTDDLTGYNQDWLKMVCGYSAVVLKPKTTQELSEVMKVCYKENLAVVPQGGNTGLVGGSVPVFDEVIISMTNMNKIIQIEPIGGTVTCEAGCILETVDTALSEHGLMMPLDLGAKASCQIGGNLSTCAGGLRLLRYGSLLGNTLGLEVVKANGDVLNLLNTLKKDNTGYHLRQLFIGSEGTLGIITKAAIQTPQKPEATSLALIGLTSFDNVLRAFRLAKKVLCETLSSCEMMDAHSMTTTAQHTQISNPIPNFDFYMVIEAQGSNQSHVNHKMDIFLETAVAQQIIGDGTVTDQPSHILKLWGLRERITESLMSKHYMYKYDITLPLSKFYECVQVIEKQLKSNSKVVAVSGFGHLGDGNLHLNVQTQQFEQDVLAQIEPFIFEWTQQVGGSISAEHGIGFKKAKYLKYGKSPEAIQIMKELKQIFDPTGILNPYKVLPNA